MPAEPSARVTEEEFPCRDRRVDAVLETISDQRKRSLMYVDFKI